MSFWSAQEMLNFQCQGQVMQQEWAWAICGFCGFFSVCQQMPELTHHSNCQWPEPSSVNTSISILLRAGIKERRDSQRLQALLSYLVSLWPWERGMACLMWVIQKYNLQLNKEFPQRKYSDFFQGVVSEVELLKHVFRAPSAAHICGDLSANTVEDTVMHKTKRGFPPSLQSDGEETSPWDVIIHASPCR